MTAHPKKAERNQSNECTYLSFSESEQNTSEQNVKHSQEQSIDLELTPDRTLPELKFISINQQYEVLMISKMNQPKMKQFDEQERKEQLFICFCGKEMKRKKLFIQHVQSSHRFSVESLSFLKSYKTLKKQSLDSDLFKLDTREYLKVIKKCSCNQLKLPEEMMILPLNLREKFRIKIQGLLKWNIETDNQFFFKDSFPLVSQKKQNFSVQFMERLRILVISHFEIFDRQMMVHLRNMVVKDVLFLFLFNLFDLLKQIKEFNFGERTRSQSIFLFSRLAEGIAWNFLKWIDKNYLKIMQKHQIFSNYLQITKEERYSEGERLQNFNLFLQQYLRFIQTKNLGKALKQFAKFFIESTGSFVRMVVSEDDFLSKTSSGP